MSNISSQSCLSEQFAAYKNVFGLCGIRIKEARINEVWLYMITENKGSEILD